MNAIAAVAVVSIKELYRRKDFYVLFFLAALIVLGMWVGNLTKDEKLTGALKEICFLLIWISGLVIAVGTAARQIPSERENRTIYPLLAKPVTRGQIITGKFIGCWLACAVALAIFYFCLAIVIASREHSLNLGGYLEAFWMQWMFLAIVIAAALWGSLLLPAQSSNITICLIASVAILLLVPKLGSAAILLAEPLRSVVYAVYFLVPHFEWFNLKSFALSGSGTAGWTFCLLSTLYAACYAGFFLLGTWLSFRRRALAA